MKLNNLPQRVRILAPTTSHHIHPVGLSSEVILIKACTKMKRNNDNNNNDSCGKIETEKSCIQKESQPE